MFFEGLKDILGFVERFNDKYDGELLDREFFDYVKAELERSDYDFAQYLSDFASGVDELNSVDLDLYEFPYEAYLEGIGDVCVDLLRLHNVCVMFYKMLVMFDREVKYRGYYMTKSKYDLYGEKMLARFEYNDYWYTDKKNTQNTSVDDSGQDDEQTSVEIDNDETNNSEA